MDFRIEGKGGVPLFVCGVLNQKKARLANITHSIFHRHNLEFELAIAQMETSWVDPVRFSDVLGDMVSSMEAIERLNRKLSWRTA